SPSSRSGPGDDPAPPRPLSSWPRSTGRCPGPAVCCAWCGPRPPWSSGAPGRRMSGGWDESREARTARTVFLPPPSGQLCLFIEPAHHYRVEGIGRLDIAEVAGVWDLLEAATRHQFGEAAHRFCRSVWILGTADRQCRDLKRRELGREVVILDRRRAA